MMVEPKWPRIGWMSASLGGREDIDKGTYRFRLFMGMDALTQGLCQHQEKIPAGDVTDGKEGRSV